ncbi:MAG: hypothetical protein ACI4SH_05585, partial [Candidatus Scatosoma sp.]
MIEYKRLTQKIDSGFVSELDCRIAYNRLSGLEDKIENGTLVKLPCKVGDTVYGVDFTDCKQKYATTEKEKRKIFNVCCKMNGHCDK